MKLHDNFATVPVPEVKKVKMNGTIEQALKLPQNISTHYHTTSKLHINDRNLSHQMKPNGRFEFLEICSSLWANAYGTHFVNCKVLPQHFSTVTSHLQHSQKRPLAGSKTPMQKTSFIICHRLLCLLFSFQQLNFNLTITSHS